MEYSVDYHVKIDNNGKDVVVAKCKSGKTIICKQEVKAMQFIFNNEKGQSVFEGDVVDFFFDGKSYTGLVMFSPAHASFVIRSNVSIFPIELARTSTVIGNIEEFPFLLEMVFGKEVLEELEKKL